MEIVNSRTWEQSIFQEPPRFLEHQKELFLLCDCSGNGGRIKIFQLPDLSLYREYSAPDASRKIVAYETCYGPWLFPVDDCRQFFEECVETRIITDEDPRNDIILRLSCKDLVKFLPNERYLCVGGENLLCCRSFRGETLWSKEIQFQTTGDLEVSIVDGCLLVHAKPQELLYVMENDTGKEIYKLKIPYLTEETYYISMNCFKMRGFDTQRNPIVYQEYVLCNGKLEARDLFSIQDFSLSQFSMNDNFCTLLGVIARNGQVGTICWNLKPPNYEFEQIFFKRNQIALPGELVGAGNQFLHCVPTSGGTSLTLYNNGKCGGKLKISGQVFAHDIRVWNHKIFAIPFEGTDKSGKQTYRIDMIEI